VHPDLESEQAYIDQAYSRLEQMRTNAGEMLRGALSSGKVGTPGAVEEREIMVRTSLQRLEQLDIGRESLCFGRIDREDDESFHIGRLAISSADSEPLVVDWRAPVVEPFYRATGRHPLGLRRRRHFLAEGRLVLDIEDELFAGGEAGDELGLAGSGALVAALERSRSGRMRDIVATVQREQDEIIRAPLPGILVVQGGPGTGKTAVALHRAAYLLYTHRFPLERQGVLVIGPNRLFLRYIEHVLPSLGESGVVLSTVEGLTSEIRVRALDPPGAARVKGDERMARVIARAVRDRQRPLRRAVEVGFGLHRLRITPDLSAEVVAFARRRPGPHNARRRLVEAHLWRRLHAQYVEVAQRAVRTGVGGGEELSVDELGHRLRRDPDVVAALDRMWPLLTPPELLHDLFGAPALLHLAGRGILSDAEIEVLGRARSHALDEIPWTAADVPLADEAAVLLGPRAKSPRLKTENVQQDDDGPRTYGHIVVDEAQDLSPMQLRMISRRSISGSMTVVGDLAQATGQWAPAHWDEVARFLPESPSRLVELSVNYRTPSEIMNLAARVLAQAAPGIRQPESVRDSGVAPTRRRAAEGALGLEVARAAVEGAAPGDGNVGIVCPDSLTADIADALSAQGIVYGEPSRHGLDETITVVPMSVAKGLEFDVVIVVEPARLVREAPQGLRALYVALTRATKRLTIVHSEPLPEAIVEEPRPADPVPAA
jgi:DNA helicase IV